jgi:hypothetical protein
LPDVRNLLLGPAVAPVLTCDERVAIADLIGTGAVTTDGR